MQHNLTSSATPKYTSISAPTDFTVAHQTSWKIHIQSGHHGHACFILLSVTGMTQCAIHLPVSVKVRPSSVSWLSERKQGKADVEAIPWDKVNSGFLKPDQITFRSQTTDEGGAI